MTNIVPFDFKGNPVRVIEINGEPWFVGKDVAQALGYSNPRKALLDHCKKAQAVGGSRFVTPYVDGQLEAENPAISPVEVVKGPRATLHFERT